MKYNIENIAKILDGDIAGNGDIKCEIKNLLIDSRSKNYNKNSLFFAIVGTRNNGHFFIEELYNNGFYNFVVNKTYKIKDSYKNVNFIVVNDTLTALQKLASYKRNKFSNKIIGITGSNGKTIVKEWLSQLLSYKEIVKNPKSFNSQVGVPLSIWNLNKNAEFGIFEAGISQKNEMKMLEKIIKPNIGIFANIGQAHQENFNSILDKVSEKLKLFNNSDILIYNRDVEVINNIVNKKNIRSFTWSKKHPTADLKIDKISKNKQNTEISGIHNNKTLNITIPFTDDASIENAINCLATIIYLDEVSSKTLESFKKLQSIKMRLEIKKGINNTTIINDTYNSDIGSLNIAIDLLNQQNQHKKKTIILSDILQSGINTEELYKKIANVINRSNIDKLITIGCDISQYHKLFNVDNLAFISTSDFLQNYNTNNFKNEAILLKGARIFKFEKISKQLQQKNHETVLEVNLNAITHNLNYFKSKLLPKTKIMVMVKAFSYGSGIAEIANLLQYQNVDYLAVAYTDEGIELRKSGIELPIMVMNPEIDSFNELIRYNLEPEIFSFRILDKLIDFINQSDIKEFPIHLKIDTGMKRLGFISEDTEEIIKKLKSCKKIKLQSIFTHLIATDNFKKDDFTKKQIEIFKKTAEQIKSNFSHKILLHALNSSGIERFKNAQLDMVRLGIGLYGISSTNQKKLMNISSLKTSISQIKKIKKGETIGYGGENQSKKDITIATIPIGYADGINRNLGNGKGKVLINNILAPTIGNICMDMCMIDISNIKNANEGDEVIIFNEKYTILDIAKQLETIPYEILTGISRRVKRVYLQE